MLLLHMTRLLECQGSIRASLKSCFDRIEERRSDRLSPESETINEALNSTERCPYPTFPLVALLQPVGFATFGLEVFSVTCFVDSSSSLPDNFPSSY